MRYVVLFLCLFFTCCSRHGLEVNHFVITNNYLPSAFAKTPDPSQIEPFQKQILLISYRLPTETKIDGLELKLEILFKDLSQKEVILDLKGLKGTIEYIIEGEDFNKYGPILGYRVQAGNFQSVSPLFRKMLTIDGKKIDRRDF